MNVTFRDAFCGCLSLPAVPEAPLQVQEGSAGSITAQSSSTAVFERSGQNFVSILSPNTSERGILFGDPVSNVNGGIIDNNTATLNGFQFRTGINQNRMIFASNGNVGIGTTNPGKKLDVVGDSTFRNRLGIGNPTSTFGQLTINDSATGRFLRWMPSRTTTSSPPCSPPTLEPARFCGPMGSAKPLLPAAAA